MVKDLISALQDMLFPKRCALCGEVIEIDETLCADCKKLERIKGALPNIRLLWHLIIIATVIAFLPVF